MSDLMAKVRVIGDKAPKPDVLPPQGKSDAASAVKK